MDAEKIFMTNKREIKGLNESKAIKYRGSERHLFKSHKSLEAQTGRTAGSKRLK